MSDLALVLDPGDPNFGDLDIQNNSLYLVDGEVAIQQHLMQRLRIFLGEWFMDNTIGLPFFQQILVKNPNQAIIDAYIINQILATPGIIQLNSYQTTPDFINRTLNVSFTADTTSGTVDYESLVP